MSATDPHISTATLRAARLAADRLNLDWTALLALAGLGPGIDEQPDARIPQSALFCMWTELTAHSGDEAFGIRLVQSLPHGTMGVAEYVARTSPTLRGVLEHGVRYSRLVNEGAVCTIAIEGPRCSFTHSWRYTPPSWPRAYLDWIVGYIAQQLSRLLGDDMRPSLVSFVQGPPKDIAPYEEALRCPVAFSQPVNAVTFPTDWLDRPIQAADPQLQTIMQRYAEQQLSRLPRIGGFLDEVRRAVAAQLTDGARLEEVARAMAMSPRSLQRRMRDEDTTYQAFVQHVRTELAASYLSDGEMPIGEIAFVLGYSEPSAFHRSFKRVRGVTPRQFRSSARAA